MTPQEATDAVRLITALINRECAAREAALTAAKWNVARGSQDEAELQDYKNDVEVGNNAASLWNKIKQAAKG